MRADLLQALTRLASLTGHKKPETVLAEAGRGAGLAGAGRGGRLVSGKSRQYGASVGAVAGQQELDTKPVLNTKSGMPDGLQPPNTALDGPAGPGAI
jgi:hypothetical protein